LLLFAGNKIFVERHLQSHFQAQCAFKVMRSTCPFSFTFPRATPHQAVVLVFIAFFLSKAFTILWSRFWLYLPAHLEAQPGRSTGTGTSTAAAEEPVLKLKLVQVYKLCL